MQYIHLLNQLKRKEEYGGRMNERIKKDTRSNGETAKTNRVPISNNGKTIKDNREGDI